MSKKMTVGIIAEDESDVSTAKVLIHRIAKNNKIGVQKFLGKGCGKLKRKCNAWANQLHKKGCSTMIVIHDLDKNNLKELYSKIQESIAPCPIKKYLICIPIEELEAWFLSDPIAIQKSLKLKKIPKPKGLPENIKSPKETLGKLVDKASEGEKIYINTKHNEIIAEHLSLDIVKNRCPSFIPFNDFVRQYLR